MFYFAQKGSTKQKANSDPDPKHGFAISVHRTYLAGFWRFIREVPECGERKLHGDIYYGLLHPLPHYGEQLLHVVGVGAQLARLLRRYFGS